MAMRVTGVFLLCVVRALRHRPPIQLPADHAAEILPIKKVNRRGAYPRERWRYDKAEAKRLEATLDFHPDNIPVKD